MAPDYFIRLLNQRHFRYCVSMLSIYNLYPLRHHLAYLLGQRRQRQREILSHSTTRRIHWTETVLLYLPDGTVGVKSPFFEMVSMQRRGEMRGNGILTRTPGIAQLNQAQKYFIVISCQTKEQRFVAYLFQMLDTSLISIRKTLASSITPVQQSDSRANILGKELR
jgi:hypothetical protein